MILTTFHISCKKHNGSKDFLILIIKTAARWALVVIEQNVCLIGWQQNILMLNSFKAVG